MRYKFEILYFHEFTYDRPTVPDVKAEYISHELTVILYFEIIKNNFFQIQYLF